MRAKKKTQIYCDPAVCDCCQYICEGDFICDKYDDNPIVISDWEQTEDYLCCQRRDKK